VRNFLPKFFKKFTKIWIFRRRVFGSRLHRHIRRHRAIFGARNEGPDGLLRHDLRESEDLPLIPLSNAGLALSVGRHTRADAKHRRLGEKNSEKNRQKFLKLKKFQRAVANAAIDALTARHGTDYVFGNTVEVLYVASGTSPDHAYGHFNTSLAYTYEMRHSDTGSRFVLPADQIIPNAEEILESLMAMVGKAEELGYF
jgi:hypothetical protein